MIMASRIAETMIVDRFAVTHFNTEIHSFQEGIELRIYLLLSLVASL